jgi:hypothetical protein
MHSKERIEGSPLLQILSTMPGDFQPSRVISKASLSPLYFCNSTPYRDLPALFLEPPCLGLTLTLFRIPQHDLIETLCS